MFCPYISGTAVYEKTLSFPRGGNLPKQTQTRNDRVIPDSGEVHNMAAVEINSAEMTGFTTALRQFEMYLGSG
ncbi:MAG: hypothetical protein LBB73_09635 [Dysgonamonadaceae bacterium]|jgi:hypothetical protein|nr:hypothetical protein [Dysgonamonadaceae bacterium]